MQRCVIIGGADIQAYEVIRSYLREDDFFICCDSGTKHIRGLGIVPGLVIGDFDSSEPLGTGGETVVLPREKDDTDTMAAVREAVSRGFEDYLLLGVFGNRLDHTLANIYILLWLDNRGKKVLAVDDYSEFEIISKHPGYVPSAFPYFSLLNIGGCAEGVTIKNAKYALENAAIPPDYQFGVSNEPLGGRTAEISVKNGCLLLIRDR